MNAAQRAAHNFRQADGCWNCKHVFAPDEHPNRGHCTLDAIPRPKCGDPGEELDMDSDDVDVWVEWSCSNRIDWRWICDEHEART